MVLVGFSGTNKQQDWIQEAVGDKGYESPHIETYTYVYVHKHT